MTGEFRRQNKIALFLMMIGLILSLIIMLLPLYTFRAGVFTKKSSNTFYGDEKYLAARAEVEEAAREFESSGFPVTITEDALERTNSKGETTSLYTFTIEQTFGRNLFAFLRSPLASGHVFRFLLCTAVLTLLFALLGLAGSIDTHPKYLPKGKAFFRSASVISGVLSLLSVPVFVMLNNYTFSRKLSLYRDELIEDGKEAFYTKLDSFLFNGTAGDQFESMVSKLEIHRSGLLWLLLPALLIMLVAAVEIRHGAVKTRSFGWRCTSSSSSSA